MSIDSLGAKSELKVDEPTYEVFRLGAVPGLEKLPYSLKVLAEALLRTEDGANITAETHPGQIRVPSRTVCQLGHRHSHLGHGTRV